MSDDYSKKYYAEHKETIKASSNKFYNENPNYSKQYYAEHREKIKAIARQYYYDNIEKCRKYNKEYYRKNVSYHKEYYQQNIDYVPKMSACHIKNNCVSAKQKRINAKLDELLIKKEAFKKKLAEEMESNNNVTIL
jgi:hypothetical protein